MGGALLLAALACSTCSTDDPPFVAGPMEACAEAGDEDGNGAADCDDPACADTPVCKPVCGDGVKAGDEQCDDGQGAVGDSCDSTCRPASITYVKASNTDSGDFFGRSIALSADGSTLAIGALGEASAATGVGGDQVDNRAYGAGAVYVFTRSGGTWAQEAYVKASNSERADYFGASLALSADGSTLAVGSPDEDSAANGVGGDQADNSANDAGAVYVFTRSGGTWAQEAYVKASNSERYDYFGASLALSANGSTLAVGATGEASAFRGDQMDNSASEAGAVYVFMRHRGTWAQQAYVKAPSIDRSDAFGSRVALSSDGATLAVTAVRESSAATGVNGDSNDNSGWSSGAGYIFTLAGTTWTRKAYLKASNAEAFDFLGRGLALSGDGATVVFGTGYERSAATGRDGDQLDNSQPGAGAAYVFGRSGITWRQRAYVKATNTWTGDLFGNDLALSADGSTLAVGASSEDSGAVGVGGDQANDRTVGAGAVYVYR